MPWYSFTPPWINGNICDPNNYTLITILPPSCPGANNLLCAIQALDNMGKPVLTPALICEIGSSLQNRIAGVNVLLRP